MRVAVVFFGLARRVTDTRAAIQRHIYDCNPEVSFFTLASLNIVQRVHNPRSKERGVKLDPAQALLLPADLHVLAPQNDAAIAAPLAVAQRREDVFRDGWVSTRNLLHQQNSLRRAWAALGSLAEGDFDQVLFVRPDLLYLDPIRIAETVAGFQGERNIAIPSWEGHGGHNDRFALADAAAARVYATRIERLPDYLAHHPLHSESFLAFALREAGCQVRDLPVRARRVRSTGAIVNEDFTRDGSAPRQRGLAERALGRLAQHVRLPWLAR